MTKGRWIDIEPIQLYWGDLSPQVKCSVCNKQFNAIVATKIQCPNCKSEMTPQISDNAKYLLRDRAKRNGFNSIEAFLEYEYECRELGKMKLIK